LFTCVAHPALRRFTRYAVSITKPYPPELDEE